MDKKTFYHSVTLDTDKCMGCTHCIKRCPTEAIRVRNGKAKIIKERCIDCGECIRVCPHHAKHAITDSLDILKTFKYNVALPAPSLYGQFYNMDEVDIILNALLRLGFDDIFEVAKAAEIVSDVTREYVNREDVPKPVISSACPSVVRLIRVRFPQFLEYLLPFHAPIELAAKIARKEAVEKTGLKPEEIGIIFISPCPAKKTAVTSPLGLEKSGIDAVVAIKDVYPLLRAEIKELEQIEEKSDIGRMGINWGASGGEATALMNDRYLAADGIENVIKTLEEMENEDFSDLDYIELNSCPGGCVGGVLTVENPYIAKAKLKRVSKYLPVSRNKKPDNLTNEDLTQDKIEYQPVLQLSDDLPTAIQMMQKIKEIQSRLSGIDCGSCGAPTCQAHAEDVVRGFATEDGCIYLLREKAKKLSEEMIQLANMLPQAMQEHRSPKKQDAENDEEGKAEAKGNNGEVNRGEEGNGEGENNEKADS